MKAGCAHSKGLPPQLALSVSCSATGDWRRWGMTGWIGPPLFGVEVVTWHHFASFSRMACAWINAGMKARDPPGTPPIKERTTAAQKRQACMCSLHGTRMYRSNFPQPIAKSSLPFTVHLSHVLEAPHGQRTSFHWTPLVLLCVLKTIRCRL